MLKRFFPVPSATTDYMATNGNIAMGMPQPIGNADKQRLIKLSDAQGQSPKKVCISQWSEQQWPEQGPSSSHGHNQTGGHTNNDDRTIHNQPSLTSELGHATGGEPLARTGEGNGDRASSQLQQYIRQQNRLLWVERNLRKTLNFSTITGTTVVESAALFGADQVSLLRYDSEQRTCQQIVRYCQNQTLAWQPAFSLSQAEFPHLLQQLWKGKTLCISSHAVVSSSDPAANEYRQWLTRWPGNWLLVPIRQSSGATALVADSETETSKDHNYGYWGVMALSLLERESWTEDAIAAAHSITIELAAALEKSQQYQELVTANQELQKLALSDGLTSLANRRRFDEHLADEWQRLARDRQPLSLILCDLDHFKRYNDTFGHPAGDRCLIRVARALLNGPQRPADLVARYGGEEFAIILPNTDTHGAWRIAQKIHDSIRALKIDHAPSNEEPYVTVTMGVSTVIPGHENTAQMLVQASDLALYHAKQQGRNRTYVNGHYNTVNTKTAEDTSVDNSTALDVMPSSDSTPAED